MISNVLVTQHKETPSSLTPHQVVLNWLTHRILKRQEILLLFSVPSELLYLKPIYGIAAYCVVNNIRTRINPGLYSLVWGNVQAGERPVSANHRPLSSHLTNQSPGEKQSDRWGMLRRSLSLTFSG